MHGDLYVYGAGKRFERLVNISKNTAINIIGVFDGNESLIGHYVCGYKVLNREIIYALRNATICISIEKFDVREQILQSIQKMNPNIVFVAYEDIIVNIFWSALKESVNIGLPKLGTQFMNIFDCPNGMVLGGVETWSVNLCRELNRTGHKSIVLAPKRSSVFCDCDSVHFVHQLNVKSGFVENFDDIWIYLQYLLRNLPCNVITCSADALMIAACVMKRFFSKKIRIISVIHNLNDELIMSHTPFLREIDQFVGVSQEIVNQLKNMQIESSPVQMNLPFMCKDKLEHLYTLDIMQPIKLCFAGRLVIEQKRVDLLIKVLKELKCRKVHFLMQIAGSGDFEDSMRRLVRDEQLDNCVVFMGQIAHDDMFAFFETQDIYINCSDYEGNCISKLEAMGCGCVPIVTKTSGIEGIVSDGENGYVVPVGDFMKMVDKIEYLFKNRNLLEKMGRKAHELIYPLSSMSNHLSQWSELLTSFVN